MRTWQEFWETMVSLLLSLRHIGLMLEVGAESFSLVTFDTLNNHRMMPPTNDILYIDERCLLWAYPVFILQCGRNITVCTGNLHSQTAVITVNWHHALDMIMPWTWNPRTIICTVTTFLVKQTDKYRWSRWVVTRWTPDPVVSVQLFVMWIFTATPTATHRPKCCVTAVVVKPTWVSTCLQNAPGLQNTPYERILRATYYTIYICLHVVKGI